MKTKLGDITQIITGPFGSQLHMSDYVSQGYPVIMPQNIVNRCVDERDIARINEVNFKKLNRYAVQPNDIIFARRGKVEEHAFIDTPQKMLCGTGCFRVRVTSKEVNPLYLSLYLSRPTTKKWLISHAIGSNMPNLNTDILSNVPLELPEYAVQVRIAQCLQSIDDKIKCNNEINDNLAQQAKFLYDYWFTQFDFPNENNKPYRSSGGQMVWNDFLKKEIPIGWSVKPIIDFSHIYQPQTISNSLFNEEYPYYVYGGGGLIGKYNKYNHTESEIIISCRGNCGNVLISMPNSWITGNAMVVHPDETVTKRYLYEFLRSYGIEKYISGSVQKQLTRENLSIMPIIVPPKPILNKFDAIVSNITAKQQSLFTENQELIRLRNWLLPLLMNGQATIAE